MDKANQPSKPVRIFIVEDEHRIARFLQIELEHEGFETETEENGTRAYERIMQGNFDLVLLDVMLPGMDGLTICKRVREVSSLPIIMLTAKDEVEDKVAGLDIGADDYLIKPFSFDELSARLRVMTRKKYGEKTGIISVGDLTVDTAARRVERAGREISLSAKEYELLQYLVMNKGVVLSREKIEDHIWNYDYEGGTNVVDVYIRYLRKKIDEGEDIKLIHTVRGAGYVIK